MTLQRAGRCRRSEAGRCGRSEAGRYRRSEAVYRGSPWGVSEAVLPRVPIMGRVDKWL